MDSSPFVSPYASPFVPRYRRELNRDCSFFERSYDIIDEDELYHPDLIVIDPSDENIDYIHVIEYVNLQQQRKRMLVWYMIDDSAYDLDNNDPLFIIEDY